MNSGGPLAKLVVDALAAVYGLAFFALVAGYFWARWYAVGVGLFGVIARRARHVAGRRSEPRWACSCGSSHSTRSPRSMLWGEGMSLGVRRQDRVA